MNKYLKYIYPYDWLVLGYVVFALLLSSIIGFRIDFSVVLQYQYDITFLNIILLYFLIYVSILALRYRREGKDAFICGSYWRKAVRERYFHWRNIVDLIRVLFLLKVTLLIYCNIKQAIPFINGTLYDSELLVVDRIVHLGINPNTFTVKLLGGEIISPIMDRIYISWYMLKPLVLAFFAIIPDRRIHIRFFTAYFALWISGGLFAVLIPSLGPIYTHPSWFQNVKMHFASSLQSKLMLHYDNALTDPEKYKVYIYEGVAAFPSLHIGIVALFAFFLLKINRTAGILMIVYTILIQVGSVLLGWHYAVDGYFGILLAFLLFHILKDPEKTARIEDGADKPQPKILP